jgi:hypothetical protein
MSKRIVSTEWGMRRQYCHCDVLAKGGSDNSGWSIAVNMSVPLTAGSADKMCDVCGMYPWTFKRLKDEKKWKELAGYIPIRERGKEGGG